jgi:hypothetical protein
MVACIFVKLQPFWNSDDLKKDELTADVVVSFLNQIIQSPYGMPLHHDIDQAPKFAIKLYDDDYYASHHGADFTGKTVPAYLQLILLAARR